MRRADDTEDWDRSGKRGRARGEAQTKEERVAETVGRAERWMRTIGVGGTKAFMAMVNKTMEDVDEKKVEEGTGLAAKVLDWGDCRSKG